MKMNKLALACGAALMGVSALAQAEFSANVALTSNYVFRGYTQNDNEMAIQGGFDYSHDSGFYAGVWGSNVDSTAYNGATIEVDTYIGYATEVNGIGVDLNANRFNYPGSTVDSDNTNEFSVSLSKDFEVVAVSAKLAYSPEFFSSNDSIYYGLGADVPVGPATVSATYGVQDTDGSAEVADWSLAVSGELEGFGLALTYTDIDDSAEDSHVFFTVSREF